MLAAPQIHTLNIEQLEVAMLDLPQVECPVIHHFGPGIYIREVTLPAGTVAIGHKQKFPHLNILLSGSVAIIDDSNQVKVLKAPLIFTGKPGRKVGYVLETCTWQNVYSTSETDVDKLENMFLDKSAGWSAHNVANQLAQIDMSEIHRQDFADLLVEANISADVVRQQSENTADQCPMPVGYASNVTIRQSPIEGHGVFLSSPVREGDLIGPARIFGLRTPIGRYTNHSKTPNAVFVKSDDGDIFLIASKNISGCIGGGQGEEVTVDYRQALSLSGIYLKGFKS